MLKKNIQYLILIIIAFSILVIFLCYSNIGYRVKRLDEKNPTSYIFHTSYDQLKEIIRGDFSKGLSKDISDRRSVLEIGSRQWNVNDEISLYLLYLGDTVFEKPENKLDLYLTPSGDRTVSYSKVYKKFWKSLEYFAEFQLHFEPINENETKITVITHAPEVLYSGSPVFSGHAYVNFKKVEPTTIEEYEILLRIGKLIGEKDMPPLKLPTKK
ncbi:MAG TPA: hypothetical protein VK205_14555 [Prolixibacteraceae bacterium]|nr:hypothetical protein [Prolixibacteraceae bacterium]